MSFNALVISLQGVGKTYKRFAKPSDRFWQAVWPSAFRSASQTADVAANEFVALAPLNLEVCRGEALGLVGRNGAGKSTLLQMVCGTLNPSSGSVVVQTGASVLGVSGGVTVSTGGSAGGPAGVGGGGLGGRAAE